MKRAEDQLQRAICQLLAIYERRGDLQWFAIPNGGKRSKIEAAVMKGLGVRAGVPDLCILFANNGPTIFLELKAGTNKPTRNQKTWLEWLNANGRKSHVIYSVDEVYSIIKGILNENARTAGRRNDHHYRQSQALSQIREGAQEEAL